MRLVRAGEQKSLVADDIRAGLTALGRGNSVVGGLALLNVTPQGSTESFAAVVVTPHGVLIVQSVDLPGPALRLDAPLHGQWKADNWPLVGAGDSINPGSAALASADRLARRLHAQTQVPVPIAAILAVGPYVETVRMADSDRVSPVRVLHPTPTTLRDAIGALAPPRGLVCSVEQARALLRILHPELPIQPDSALAKEGFVAGSSAAHATHGAHGAHHVEHNAITPPPELLPSSPPPPPPAAARSRSELRLLPIAAVLLLVAGIIAAIVMAAGGATGAAPESGLPNTPQPQVRHAVDGLEFTEVAKASEQRCADRTFGDVQAALEREPCLGMRLGSYLTAKDGKRAAVSIAVLQFADQTQAEAFKKVADTPGSGGAVDFATSAQSWPEGAPTFDYAAFRSATSNGAVRLVQAVWVDERSSQDDKSLRQIAETAFEVPLTD